MTGTTQAQTTTCQLRPDTRWSWWRLAVAAGLVAFVVGGTSCSAPASTPLSWTAEYDTEELEQAAARWLLFLHEGTCEQRGMVISTWDAAQGEHVAFSRPGLTGDHALRLLVVDEECQTIGEGCADLDVGRTTTHLALRTVAAQSLCPAAFCDHGRCYGDNVHEDLSRGQIPRCDRPRNGLPEGHDGSRRLALGPHHSCALLGGQVRCWGRNHAGQLGLGNRNDTGEATRVEGLEGAISLAAGQDFTCALLDVGTVWCWGSNSAGQLGDGTFDGRTRPVRVVELSDVVGIAAGGSHACARTTEKKLWCWGGNDHGQLGNDSARFSTRPVEVNHTERTIAVAAVGNTSCIVEHCGHLRCFGMNVNGVRGEDYLADRLVPGPGVLHPVSDLSLGGWSSEAHALAIRQEGRLYGWGSNDAGELGDGTFDGRWEPVEIEFSDGPAQVAAGHRFSCLLSQGGQPYCWGSNSRGQLGHGALGLTPTALSTGSLPAFEEIAAGIDHACVRAGDDLWCWGSNDYGKRGNGATAEGTSLAAVPIQAEPAE